MKDGYDVGSRVLGAASACVVASGLFLCGLGGALALADPAPNVPGDHSSEDPGKGPKTDYRTFPGALLSSFASLLSGASVGPEGPVTILVQDIAAWVRARLRVSMAVAALDAL